MIEYGFHHLHLRTRDPEGVAKFLVGNFGGAEASRTETQRGLTIRVRVGGQTVSVSSSVPGDGYEGDMSQLRLGLDHYGLSVNDLDAAYADLTAKGVKFVEPPRAGGTSRIAFLLAPDNVRIELVEVR